MRCRRRDLGYWKRADLIELHRAVARQSLVLGSNFSSLVRELPGRISEDRLEPPAFRKAQQILSGGKHRRLQGIRHEQRYTRYMRVIVSCSRYVLKIVGDKYWLRVGDFGANV